MSAALAGKHALVTGASGAIGGAIVAALAVHGANLSLLGRDKERLTRAARSAPAARAIEADVGDPASIDAAFVQARAAFGDVEILVNAAGVASSSPFVESDLEVWQSTLAVNLTAVYCCCRAAIPDMLRAGFGRVVNIASTAGLVGGRYVAAYCASKHGVVGLTRSLALEFAGKNITVNAVCPGFTESAMLERAVANIVAKTGRTESAAREALLRTIPRGRFTKPEEVANAVGWLCLPGSEAVTGQAIAVDGGGVSA
jgi:NAD(P)-dependent dehydrogenase (short-subunit alcohol dehydrogenase family)